jgi:hypothetical protein
MPTEETALFAVSRGKYIYICFLFVKTTQGRAVFYLWESTSAGFSNFTSSEYRKILENFPVSRISDPNQHA